MRFGVMWHKWVNTCMKSAPVFVLMNGSPSREFKMERGPKQGDPFSPFLFLIAVEDLHVLTLEACNKGVYKGISLTEDDANVSIFQYAHDALFFDEWSYSNANTFVKILKCFQDVSGLKVNLSKSRLYGVGVSLNEVASVTEAINCAHDKLPFIYLGLLVGRNMRIGECWNMVVDRSLWLKLWNWWKCSSLSSFSLADVLLNRITFSGRSQRAVRALYGACHVLLWSIWRWRDKLLHASSIEVDVIKHEDIFPSIQRLSLLWMSNRSGRDNMNWRDCIQNSFKRCEMTKEAKALSMRRGIRAAQVSSGPILMLQFSSTFLLYCYTE
uniref:Arginine repressor C-terminal-like domain-containing protein n=1 Tax=Tanacetum cinerariifolium TaxID=118510 RepID=A0A6L2P5U0_TANCI|nr:arginine repressor C-terminal-like domain-containing protein [Tanacetum cinerariifolium]